MKRFLRRAVVPILASWLLLAGCTPNQVTPSESPSLPTRSPSKVTISLRSLETIAVIGDSVSVGVSACDSTSACREASWAGGSDAKVNSVASRIAKLAGRTPRIIYAARPGADVASASNEVRRGLADSKTPRPQLTLVLLGANDACASTSADMTPAAEFGESYRRLLDDLFKGAPGALTLAMSVPSIEQLWKLNHEDPSAMRAWSRFWGCNNLLRGGSSADRSSIVNRVTEYNQIIARECTAARRCVYDGGALNRHTFRTSEISGIDFFHPSKDGQRAIAEIAWSVLKNSITA